MIIWTLFGIMVLFVLFAFLREPFHKKFGFKVCAICAAVGLTWVVLLILRFSGFVVDSLLIGILMGESIVGIMYLFENKAKKRGKKNLLWLKVIIIIIGTLLVYLLLVQGFSSGFIIVLIISIILATIINSILKSKKTKDVIPKRYGKFEKEIKKLEEKLEHCCD